MSPIFLPVPLIGGVNRLMDPRRIGDAEAVTLRDMVPTRSGILARRPALTQVQEVVAGISTNRPVAVRRAVNPAGPDWVFLRKTGTNASRLYAKRADGAINVTQDWAFTGVSPKRPAFADFNGRLYVFPGWDVVTNPGSAIVQGRFIDNTNAIQTMTFAGSGNANWAPRIALVSRDRFWFWNLGENHTNRMVVSEDSDPTTVGDNTLLANGRAFLVGDDGSGDGIALVEVMLTAVGAPAQAAILALCQYSAFLITGEPATIASGVTGTDILGDLDVKKLPVNCGCAAKETVVRTPVGLLWAGYDDVWLMVGNQVPIRVGTKIRAQLQANDGDMAANMFAGYRNGFYYLSMFSEASASEGNDETWMLDLREGAPQDWSQARWYGPMKFRTGRDADYTQKENATAIFNMFEDPRASEQPRLYGLELGYSTDRTQSAIVEVEYDGDDPDYNSYIDSNTMYPGIEGKDYEFKDPMIKKVYRGIEMAVTAFGQLPLEVGVNIDGGETSSTTEIEFTDEDSRDAQVVRPASAARPQGFTLQPTVEVDSLDSGGRPLYIIDDRNDAIVANFDGNYDAVALTHGIYSLGELITMVGDAWGAGSGISFLITDRSPISIEVDTLPNNWGLVFTTGAHVYDEEMVSKCRNFATMLGFDAGPDQTLQIQTQTATRDPTGNGAGKFEVSGVGLHVVPIPRRPA